jgi:hypothetical protein
MSHESGPGFIELTPASAVEQYHSIDELACPAGCLDRKAGA